MWDAILGVRRKPSRQGAVVVEWLLSLLNSNF